MTRLQAARQRHGLSQRVLAKKAGLAFRTIQLLETGRHNPRWSSLIKIARLLDIRPEDIERPFNAAEALLKESSVAAASARIIEEGEDSWKRELFNFIDAFRAHPHDRLVAIEPDFRLNRRLQAIFASTVETLCLELGIRTPWWTRGIPALAEPWFVADVQNLKAMALLESPAPFRQKNIFVLSNMLERR